jgi:hypothetical protein
VGGCSNARTQSPNSQVKVKGGRGGGLAFFQAGWTVRQSFCFCARVFSRCCLVAVPSQ